jgi:hypothetical protein
MSQQTKREELSGISWLGTPVEELSEKEREAFFEHMLDLPLPASWQNLIEPVWSFSALEEMGDDVIRGLTEGLADRLGGAVDIEARQ